MLLTIKDIECVKNFTAPHCHKTNHTVDKCFQLHGFPPGYPRGRDRGTHTDASSSAGRSVHNVVQLGSDGIAASLSATFSQSSTSLT